MDTQNLALLYENILTEAYNEDFFRKQIARLQPQAGPYVTPEQIRKKIERFRDLKGSWRTSGEIVKKVTSATQEGRKPADEREGAAITPQVKGLNDQQIEELRRIDPHNIPQKLKIAYKKYIDELKRINMLEKVPLEIRNYTWNDLETIIDQFPDPGEKQELKQIAATGTGAKLIYDKNKLQIFLGADGNECYILKKYVSKELKQDPDTYRWCISADPTGASNYHSRYRFGSYGADTAKSSYFVYDQEKPVTDKWHFFVIHVAEKPQPTRKGGDSPYMVTSALNDSDVYMTWNDILALQPKLKGLEPLFKFMPLTEEEQLQQAVASGNADTFKNYSSFKVKRAYIKKSPNNKIYKKDYLKLDPVLQHLYVNMRTPVGEDENQFDMLQKLMMMFEDSDPDTDMMDIIDKSREDMRKTQDDENDTTWVNVLADNPTINASKETQTVKRYRSLIQDVATGVGRAMEAQKRRELEQKGNA